MVGEQLLECRGIKVFPFGGELLHQRFYFCSPAFHHLAAALGGKPFQTGKTGVEPVADFGIEFQGRVFPLALFGPGETNL